jgi:murein L,D-transpeptidase YcbB/YkuD
VVDSNQTQTVFLPRAIPILLPYMTAAVDAEGPDQFPR